MESPEKPIYRFENIEVNTLRGYLMRGDVEQHLRQKAFQVLVYLLEQRGRLVTKDELMSEVWNNVAVTDDALVQCIKEIRRVTGDDSHRPRFIKTVPKAGYRFIGQIEEHFTTTSVISTEEITSVEIEYDEEDFYDEEQFRHTADARALLSVDKFVSLSPRRRVPAFPRHFFAAALILIVSAAIFLPLYFSLSKQSSLAVSLSDKPGKRGIAVMFFENQSRTAEFEWMREGLADMLITNFSRSEKLSVLSRQQLHILLERNGLKTGDDINPEKALEIAQKSHAEFVVVGSFARWGDKLRLDVKIHNVETGQMETAESLTVEKPEQILSEIDLLCLKLIKNLNISEPQRPQRLADVMTDNLEAYRYYSTAVEKAQSFHNKEAIELLEKAVALDPEFAMAHARIGHTYAITWGWTEKAKPQLEKAFALSNRLTEKDRLYITAWYAIANLDYPSAIQSFQDIVSKYPAEVEAYLRLGYLLRGEEKYDEAIKVLRQGLAIDQESSAIYNALGLIYSLLGRHDEAIVMHERYVELAPNESNAHDSLAMSYQWAGRYENAIAEYHRALELDADFEIAYAHLGTAYFQTGRYRTAIEWYKKYISIAPSRMESARGYSYISHVYQKQKNAAAAIQAAKQAIKEDEFNVREMFLIASERGDRVTAGKLEKQLFSALGFTNRGSRLSPRFAFYNHGYIAMKNGRTDEALENFREALRHSPPTWDIDPAEDCLAKAYLETGRIDEAVAEYERILRLNPNYPLARFHLAQAYEQKGLNDKAREAYRDFLETWKNADTDIPEIISAQKSISEL